MADEQVTTTTTSAPTFFSGWRPLVGWISVVSLTIQFILIPIVETIYAMVGHPIDIHGIEMTPLVTLVTTTLGIGGLRTVEKIKKVAS